MDKRRKSPERKEGLFAALLLVVFVLCCGYLAQPTAESPDAAVPNAFLTRDSVH